MNIRVFIFFAGLIGMSALVWFLADVFPGSLENDIDQAQLVRAFGIMALVGAGLMFSPRLNLKGAMKSIVIWVLIGLGVFAVYSLRDDFAKIANRMGGELMPSRAVTNNAGEITIQRSSDGHFHIFGKINGVSVPFLIDTGASVVTLSAQDAQRVGIEPDTLTFNRQFNTANGTTLGASIRIPEIVIGDIAIEDARAAILKSGLNRSLLGLSLLDQLSRVSVEGDTMTLAR